jgi:beta-1,4-mannooligosaccharide/beta-1,4-mannosyl-N-acetylglucosamine phosphorylase
MGNTNESPTIIGPALPNIPWEERPKDCTDVVWRSSSNPIIPRDLIPNSNSIFNSAVVPFGDKFAGVFRVDNKRREMRVHSGKSQDGIHWEINREPIEFICDIPEFGRFEHYYDPRVWWIEDRYYVTWCNGYHGPTIGVGYTHDFEAFYQLENAFLPYNRNGVLFPRRINGKYAMLSRPSDTGHTPFGDIFYSESPDMCHWGRHRHVMSPTRGSSWQSTKIGAGPTPIETTEGWLLFYHGVLTSCNGYVYSMGAALLDLDEPWEVLYRSAPYLLSPQKLYECVGDTPNVVFPCAALFDAPTGRIAIYYGGADTVTCLAYTRADELVEYVKANSDFSEQTRQDRESS